MCLKYLKMKKILWDFLTNLRLEIETWYVAGVCEGIIADFSATSVLLISSSSWKFTFSTSFTESNILANNYVLSELSMI